jgi:hypothetical protein
MLNFLKIKLLVLSAFTFSQKGNCCELHLLFSFQVFHQCVGENQTNNFLRFKGEHRIRTILNWNGYYAHKRIDKLNLIDLNDALAK